jgi:hypothetical protein
MGALSKGIGLRVYVTHCGAKKDDSLKNSNRKVTPDGLYEGTRIKRFMLVCKERKVRWAIFSDLYGVWFSDAKHQWYDKAPDDVSESEFRDLVADFDRKLRGFDEIWFYYSPSRFHRLYDRLTADSRLKDRITLFTHLREIR